MNDLLSIPFLLFLGIICGILSSAPIGSSNLWVGLAALNPNKTWIHIFFFSLGVIFIDVGYAAISFFGYFSILKDSGLVTIIAYLGGVLLIILGILEFKKRHDHEVINSLSIQTHPLRDMLTGSLLCGSNPAFVMFWIVVAKLFQTLGYSSWWSASLLFIGVGIGDFIWYFLFFLVIQKSVHRLSQGWICRIRFAVACLLVFLGVWSLFQGGQIA